MEASRDDFLAERRRVREGRAALVRAAGGLGAGIGPRMGETSLLVPDRWRLPAPLPLDPETGAVRTVAAREPGPPPAAALRAALEDFRPRSARGPRHTSTAEAILELEAPPPGRYVDRDCYRVLGVETGSGGVALRLGLTSYFAVLDEAAALECEVARVDRTAARAGGSPATPLRDAIGDPSDVGARTAVASVSTLVLRRPTAGPAEFWLHRRRGVGMVAGQVHVVPTGVFQPAVDGSSAVFARDAAPWWTVVRETAEELMGIADVDERAAAPGAYETEPALSALEAARRGGVARPWLVGLGLDPLSLWLELLTVLVVDEAAFDRIIGTPQRQNAEGTLVGRTRADGTFGGLPFTRDAVRSALSPGDLAPAADALLRLAWEHRDHLV